MLLWHDSPFPSKDFLRGRITAVSHLQVSPEAAGRVQISSEFFRSMNHSPLALRLILLAKNKREKVSCSRAGLWPYPHGFPSVTEWFLLPDCQLGQTVTLQPLHLLHAVIWRKGDAINFLSQYHCWCGEIHDSPPALELALGIQPHYFSKELDCILPSSCRVKNK